MTDDLEHLINDLRGPDFWQAFTHGGGALSDRQSSAPFRAADEIARLRAENEALREALDALRLQALQSDLNNPANEWGWEALQLANAALKGPSHE